MYRALVFYLEIFYLQYMCTIVIFLAFICTVERYYVTKVSIFSPVMTTIQYQPLPGTIMTFYLETIIQVNTIVGLYYIMPECALIPNRLYSIAK